MSPPPFRRLSVPRPLFAAMVEQALAERPNECCGLLAGRILPDGVGRVEQRYPRVNAAASPVEFLSEPRGMFEAVRDMRDRGTDVLAVYHSHPASPPAPSRKDRERNYSPDVVNVIVSLAGEAPALRAWWLTEDSYQEAEWEIEDEENAPGR